MNRTYSLKPSDVKSKWYLIDAKGLPIGRLAARVAVILQGKHKPEYTRNIDTGDSVIIINAELVKATGSKEINKIYYSHTGFPGGIREISLGDLRKKAPTRILESAIKRMLPKRALGSAMYSKLKVYAGTEHPHAAQQPELLNIDQYL